MQSPRSDNIVSNKQGDCALISGTTASLRAFRLRARRDYVTLFKWQSQKDKR